MRCVNAKGVIVTQTAETGRDSGTDTISHNVDLADRKQQGICFLYGCGMASKKRAQLLLD